MAGRLSWSAHYLSELVMGIKIFSRPRSQSLSTDVTANNGERKTSDESGGSEKPGRGVGMADFFEGVVSDDKRTGRLIKIVLAMAVSVALIIAACAVPLLASGSSHAGIRISEVCGSLASLVAAVAGVAQIVRGGRRRK
jgi:hypothetical protein